jgi:two-component system sensor histidine kinase BaeS
MSLRWRIALGFALVALATAAVIALATPPIVLQGFSDVDLDSDGGGPATAATAQGTLATGEDSGDAGTTVTLPPAPSSPSGSTPGQAQQTTIVRLLLAAAAAAAAASLLGLLGASRLVRPLTRLEEAAIAVARGDLGRRSGLAERSDEFGQLGRTFDSMAGQLQLADETRRRFLQDAAHELKTPLAVIDATSSAILDGVYTPERRHLETIRDQSRVLARIVDDLRTISLAEGGNLPLDRRPQDVRRVLDSVAAGFEARAAATSIKLSVEAPPGIVVEADPDRLRQMLGALVDNALRHAPEGGTVRMAASASMSPARTGSHRLVVRLAVEDTGPGIPQEALPRVFERFYQADPSRSRGTGTSGLGLSIVRALAEAHGGRVGAENRVEGGARLWIELSAVRLT